MKKIPLWLIMLVSIVFVISGCTEKNNQQAPEEEAVTDHQTIEKEENMENPSDKVVTINERTFMKDDLSFYTLMEKIEIERNRSADQKQLKGDQLQEKEAYWDEQLSYLDNINVQLQHLIEIYSMSLLAEEKHYFIPEEQLETAVAKLETSNSKINAVQQLITQYGKKEYKQKISEYLRQSMLRDRIINDLKEELEREKPKASEQEINFELSKNYEALYMDQVKSLEIDIHIK